MNGKTNFLKRDVPYLVSVKERLVFIAFIAGFSYLFISLYNPFHLDLWGKNLYLNFIILGAVVLLISQFVLRPLLGFRRFVFHQLILWSLTEIVLMTVVFYFFYGEEAVKVQGVIFQLFDTLAQVGLVVIVPYALYIWYAEFRYRLSEFEKVKRDKHITPEDDPGKLLVFHKDNEKILFAIKFIQLLYIKSAGNYLEIYYRKGNETAREVVRGSLKDLEEKIFGTSVIKTHRSYMVNVEHISSFKKTRKGYTLMVNHVPDVFVPVSSGYKDDFEQLFEKTMSHS